MNLPRKPVEPLPPRPGELKRVRRRAAVRRMRVPGSALAVGLLAVAAYTTVGTTERPDRVGFTAPTESPEAAGESTPSPSAPPSETPTPSPSAPPSEAPTPSPAPSRTGSPDPVLELYGVVVDTVGRPLEGVLVHGYAGPMRSDGGLGIALLDRTDAAGRWRLPCQGRNVVLSSFEMYRAKSTMPGAYGYAVLAQPECGTELRTTLRPGGSIEGRLVDEQGEPVQESHTLDLLCPEDDSTSCLILRTAADGTYAFHGLHAGRYRIMTDGKTVAVDVTEGGTTTYDPVVAGTPGPGPSPSG